jgi:hypothetical protein
MYYSFVVWAQEDVSFPEHLLVIGEGFDTFNATVPDLPAFLAKLAANGVTVREVHQLDALEPVPCAVLPSDLQPPHLLK